MQIKKSSLEILSSVLTGTEGVLTLADARIRDSFAKKLKEHVDTFVADREKIYVKFCLKDKKDKPDLLNGTQFQFKAEVLKDMNPELDILLAEEVKLECPNPKKIKEFIEKTEYMPKIGEAEVIDELDFLICIIKYLVNNIFIILYSPYTMQQSSC